METRASTKGVPTCEGRSGKFASGEGRSGKVASGEGRSGRVPTDEGRSGKRRVSMSRFALAKTTPLDAASRGKGILRRANSKSKPASLPSEKTAGSLGPKRLPVSKTQPVTKAKSNAPQKLTEQRSLKDPPHEETDIHPPKNPEASTKPTTENLRRHRSNSQQKEDRRKNTAPKEDGAASGEGKSRHGDETSRSSTSKREKRHTSETVSRGPRRTPSTPALSSRSSTMTSAREISNSAPADRSESTGKILTISPRLAFNQTIEPSISSYAQDLSENLAHVSSTVDYLSKQLAAERRRSKELSDQVAVSNSEAIARGDIPLSRMAQSTNVPEPTAVTSQRHLFHRLKEERERAAALQESYEQQLAKLRAENLKKIAIARKEVLAEVDGIMKKYAKLANDAYTAAKKAQHQSDTKTIESRKIADAACAAFEKECKTKMRDVLEGYKYLADQAAQQPQQETKALKEKCREMTAKSLSERKEFETKVLELSESKVAPFKKEISSLKRENAKLKEEAENTFKDIKLEVNKQFETFENSLLSECLEILWSHKIPMSEAELRLRVTDGLKTPGKKTAVQCHCQAPCTQPCPCPCSACKPLDAGISS